MKKTFIIKAEASVGHSNGKLPLIDDFFSKAKELKRNEKKGIK